jgi:UDP-glucose 4-epimerase
MRALVTGGAGFIGSHLVDALLDAGHEVAVVDHLARGHTDNLAGAIPRGIDLIRADVTDVAAMAAACTRTLPDAIFHLAAQIDVRRSVADPSTDAHVNVGGTAAVLEAARLSGSPRVLLASTAGVYGDPADVPTSEDSPVAPLSPYGASKAAAETYMDLFARLHGLSTLSLRMSNVYGPRQDPHGESGVVAIFAGAAVEDRPVTIYGQGRQTRDYVYVADVVAAFVAAGSSSAKGVLNIATGVETSVVDLAELLGVATELAPPRAGEIDRSALRTERARAQLGWEPRVPLAEGVRRTLAPTAAARRGGASSRADRAPAARARPRGRGPRPDAP